LLRQPEVSLEKKKKKNTSLIPFLAEHWVAAKAFEELEDLQKEAEYHALFVVKMRDHQRQGKKRKAPEGSQANHHPHKKLSTKKK